MDMWFFSVDIIFQIFLAFWLWALIWVERGIYENETERQNKNYDSFGGVRSFWLIAVLWTIFWFFSEILNSSSLIIIWILIVSIFVLVFYILSWIRVLKYSITTEISAILTFFLWVLISLWYVQVAIILSILLALLMSSEVKIDKLIDKLSRKEFNDSIKFLVVSLVILPLLPNNVFSISDFLYIIWYEGNITNNILNLEFFNPYSIWMFVVLMSWISYVWYILSKVIWEKSSIIASWAIWWLASSTALTASMSELSNKDLKNTDTYVLATLIASIIMFLRVMVIVFIFNISLLSSILIPSIVMLLALLSYMIIFFYRSKKNSEKITIKEWSSKVESPFRIAPALSFAFVVLLVKFIAWLGSLYTDIWWDNFFYALWIISWLADVDALTQTMSVSSLDWVIPMEVATATIILWVMSNNMVKWLMALKFWSKKFGIFVISWFLVSMFAWIICLLFLNFIN